MNVAGQQSDFYALLGIGRSASAAEIDRAYRRAARATHPDVHPDDTSAAQRFNAVSLAHETLRDPARRASYDRTHPGVRPAAPVAIVVHRRAHHTDPVHLGRHGPRPATPQPFGPRRDGATVPNDLFELVTTLWSWSYRRR